MKLIEENQRIFKILAEREKYKGYDLIEFDEEYDIVSEEQLVIQFSNFLTKNIGTTKISVAGKNFGTFDKRFLDRITDWKQLIKVVPRIIDPAIL